MQVDLLHFFAYWKFELFQMQPGWRLANFKAEIGSFRLRYNLWIVDIFLIPGPFISNN